MRINREILLKVVRDTVSNRLRQERDLLSVYLVGSLLEDDPLLGGATDLDLVFVHIDAPAQEREILPVSETIHLDLRRHERSLYRQARQLRLHPWLGPTLFGCQVLHDPQHFLDFTQASVRGQFDRPENTLGRARQHLEAARQAWRRLQLPPGEPGPADVAAYLQAAGDAANAAACLSGPPLAQRRFLLQFPARAQAAGQPGLAAGLLGLLGGARLQAETLQGWLPAWQSAWDGLPAAVPVELSPARRNYYLLGAKAVLEGPHPEAAAWPLLHTWTAAAGLLAPDSPGRTGWQQACAGLGLLGGPAFGQRLQALDAYLDTVEETLEAWGRKNGVL
jgi:hypothetical protein